MIAGLLIALALFAALVVWRAAHNEARAEATTPPDGQLIDLDGVQVHAVVMGQGPDLVLIHGSSGNTRDMTFSLAPALADRYRVIVFDRPGLGYTHPISPTGATLSQQADLLVRAAKTLGATKPIVMGQSYGGAVALAWAVHHPDDLAALVPVAPPTHPWATPLDRFYQITSSRLGRALVIPMITALVSDARVAREVEAVFAPQSAPAGYTGYIGAGLTLRRDSMRANAVQRANLLEEITDLWPNYARISVPTEIVHGTADTIVSLTIHSEKLVQDIPGAVLTRLEGIGHMPHQIAQGDVIAAIDRAARRADLR